MNTEINQSEMIESLLIPELVVEDLGIFESVNFINDAKQAFKDVMDLRDQWKAVSDSFVKHKWIYRYIDDKQKESLEKHYANITDNDVSYGTYRRSFKYIAKFMGLPSDKIIIENIEFKKDKKDKEQWEISLKYSKGLARVKIPEGIALVHVSPIAGLSHLTPSFRSKTKGKYLYPSKRVFFTVIKNIRKNQAGLEGKRIYKYTPRSNYMYAYIDPTYSDFGSGSIYIETDQPIPVINVESGLSTLFKKKEV